MQELPAGPDAVLLDFTDEADPAHTALVATVTLRGAVSDGLLAGTEDLVPSATSILVQGSAGGGVDVLGIHRILRATAGRPILDDGAARHVEIAVHYDGEDLDDVATALGLSVDDVIAAHRGMRWRVEFMGFAPGFGYLVPADDTASPLLSVARRPHARTRVPTGSVAIAAGYSAIYPRDSPGGWNLLGHTDVELWNDSADPPALLAPGTVVHFTDAEVDGSSHTDDTDDTEERR
ncbi:5-oxoprolinase subunit B family protein [Gordonia aichiensis]|uniref:Carboxyltransferase domain-containing protein n=1 Tax=Gordonia aichiensis NBRC 108223 TaxID=1220583 RepID=L7KM67_9ACTN|nr:allophanate hydrolase subunit 1 [Gordonia aichiensis]GAC48808.1 hypothetical protein GOACH_07_00920 [Gordonia aichiensis NBRC 108223]